MAYASQGRSLCPPRSAIARDEVEARAHTFSPTAYPVIQVTTATACRRHNLVFAVCKQPAKTRLQIFAHSRRGADANNLRLLFAFPHVINSCSYREATFAKHFLGANLLPNKPPNNRNGILPGRPRSHGCFLQGIHEVA